MGTIQCQRFIILHCNWAGADVDASNSDGNIIGSNYTVIDIQQLVHTTLHV